MLALISKVLMVVWIISFFITMMPGVNIEDHSILFYTNVTILTLVSFILIIISIYRMHILQVW